jgi:iron-sulfur cluster assembly protein/iron-sulfur cluster insertion protein
MNSATESELSVKSDGERCQRNQEHAGETGRECGKALRVYIEAGGCSGMQYGMVFDEKRPDDLVNEFYGVSVLVDPLSANYLRGSVVDFADSLNGGGFKISNPNARQSCGCGKSFEA